MDAEKTLFTPKFAGSFLVAFLLKGKNKVSTSFVLLTNSEEGFVI